MRVQRHEIGGLHLTFPRPHSGRRRPIVILDDGRNRVIKMSQYLAGPQTAFNIQVLVFNNCIFLQRFNRERVNMIIN